MNPAPRKNPRPPQTTAPIRIVSPGKNGGSSKRNMQAPRPRLPPARVPKNVPAIKFPRLLSSFDILRLAVVPIDRLQSLFVHEDKLLEFTRHALKILKQRWKVGPPSVVATNGNGCPPRMPLHLKTPHSRAQVHHYPPLGSVSNWVTVLGYPRSVKEQGNDRVERTEQLTQQK